MPHSRRSNFSNSYPIVLDIIRAITKKDFKCYEVDTTDKQALEVVFVAMCYAKTLCRDFSLGLKKGRKIALHKML